MGHNFYVHPIIRILLRFVVSFPLVDIHEYPDETLNNVHMVDQKTHLQS